MKTAHRSERSWRGWVKWVGLLGMGTVVLSSCSGPVGMAPPSPASTAMPWSGPAGEADRTAARAAGSLSYAPAPESRPGLGTG
ncbi:MAG: hypothetical protein O3A92_15885 [Verrucomicrobia bacterium]|nr:hypothetical protein [Verrucomicrobiota bacterium]